MAPFHRKEDIDDFFEIDPFDPFATPFPSDVRPPREGPLGRRGLLGAWVNIAVGAVLALLIAGGAFYALNIRQDLWTRDDQHVYIELKVIDASGRPAVGATVKDRKKILGVTDSFGEWRRFVRIALGSSLLIEVTKPTSTGTLSGSKNLAIPPTPPRSGDLEVKGTVQLMASGRSLVAVRSLPQDSGMAQGGESHPAPLQVPGPAVDQKSPEPLVASPPPSRTTTAPEGGGMASALEQGTIWFTAREPQTASTVDLLQALGQRSRDLGLEVNPASPWQMQIVDFGGAAGDLIQVSAIDLSGGAARPLFSYLRVRQASPLQTARDVLWAATLHATKSYQVVRTPQGWRLSLPREEIWRPALGKALLDRYGVLHRVVAGVESGSLQLKSLSAGGDPCDGATTCTVYSTGIGQAPPVVGWQRLSLGVLGATVTSPVEIYVSGYQAWRLDAETYGYWGQPQAPANVTVIREGRIVFRQRLASEGRTVPRIHVPSPPLSSL